MYCTFAYVYTFHTYNRSEILTHEFTQGRKTAIRNNPTMGAPIAPSILYTATSRDDDSLARMLPIIAITPEENTGIKL